MPKDMPEFEVIEEAMLAFHRASFKHKTWEILRERSGVNLDRSGAALLKAILHCPNVNCRMQDIASYLGIEAPSVTRKVQELESQGLVSRNTDPDDKRASLITITKAGRASVKKLQQARLEQLAIAMRKWPADERSEFARLFKKLADDLGDHVEANV